MFAQGEKVPENATLENTKEVAAMLKRLPRDERLRVEGIIIGVSMRCGDSSSAIRDSA